MDKIIAPPETIQEFWKHNTGNLVHAKAIDGWQVTADNGKTWRFCNSPFETYHNFADMATKI